MSLELNPSCALSGLYFKTVGAVVSFAPPPGATICAQDANSSIAKAKKNGFILILKLFNDVYDLF